MGSDTPRWLPPLIVLGVAAIVPLFAATPYTEGLLVLAVVYALNVLAMHLIFGLTGILSLAQAAFWGIGAYTAAIVTVDHGAPFLVGFVAATIVAGLAGVVPCAGHVSAERWRRCATTPSPPRRWASTSPTCASSPSR
jgi:ABC-type branched-subunit amino acid transport system permease subunit